MVHLQRMLREPPHEAIGGLVETDVEPLGADAGLEAVTRRLATYNLVSVPVTDEQGRLLGAVTVDDVLDHMLPEDWREADSREADRRDADRRAAVRRAGASDARAGAVVRAVRSGG
jgi:Mg/Co/Ni transporter MgtE